MKKTAYNFRNHNLIIGEPNMTRDLLLTVKEYAYMISTFYAPFSKLFDNTYQYVDIVHLPPQLIP